MRKIYIRLIVITIACSLTNSSFGQKITSVTYQKFNPEELAARDKISQNLKFFMRMHNRYEDYSGKYNKYKERGSTYLTSLYHRRRVSAIQAVYNALRKMKTSGNTHSWLVPQTMWPLVQQLGNVEKMRHGLSSSQMSNYDYKEIIAALEKLCTADRETYNIIGSRPSGFTFNDLEANLSLEVGKLPFKIDFSSGQIKIKGSLRAGPFKATGTLGTRSRTGIKTLIIRNGRYERRYAVGYKSILLDVPESYLETNGDVMIITAKESSSL